MLNLYSDNNNKQKNGIPILLGPQMNQTELRAKVSFLVKQGKIDEAIRTHEPFKDDDMHMRFIYADLLLKKESKTDEYKKGKKEMQTLATHDPLAQYKLGVVLLREKKEYEALQYMQKAAYTLDFAALALAQEYDIIKHQ